MGRQNKLNAAWKRIQQIEFVEQLKNTNGVDADGTQSMTVLTTSEKIKETRLKLSQGNLTVL